MRKIKDVFALYNLRNIKVVAVMAFLTAISIVVGKIMQIPVGLGMRFSFENLPVLLAGFYFGPVCGMLTGVVADLIGCVIVGYTINPIITAGAATIGFLSGLIYRIMPPNKKLLTLSTSVITAHFLGSVVIKTVGLCIYFGWPFKENFMLRSINYLIVGLAEIIVLYILTNHSGFKRMISSVTGGKFEIN